MPKYVSFTNFILPAKEVTNIPIVQYKGTVLEDTLPSVNRAVTITVNQTGIAPLVLPPVLTNTLGAFVAQTELFPSPVEYTAKARVEANSTSKAAESPTVSIMINQRETQVSLTVTLI